MKKNNTRVRVKKLDRDDLDVIEKKISKTFDLTSDQGTAFDVRSDLICAGDSNTLFHSLRSEIQFVASIDFL